MVERTKIRTVDPRGRVPWIRLGKSVADARAFATAYRECSARARHSTRLIPGRMSRIA